MCIKYACKMQKKAPELPGKPELALAAGFKKKFALALA